MTIRWRVFVFLVCMHASIKTDIGLAELWVCQGTDGTEAFTDQGGPGCRKGNDSRSAVSQASQIDLKRLEYAKNVMRTYGDKIPFRKQEDILAQRVTLGMPPYEATLAAGANTFKVSADPAKWPNNADPSKVIAAQSLHPDNSEIWMTFETATQFPEKGMTRFQVYFRGGKAQEIKELAPNKESKWFIDLLQANNRKSFCVPPGQKLGEVAQSFSEHFKSHQIGDRINDMQVIQALATLYPCVGGQPLGATEMGSTVGRQVTVAPTGEYASINMQPMIVIMQMLQRTTGHENDALMAEIEQHPGNYVPPVLMALAVVHFRQGHTANAIFWFNAGRLRAMFDAARCMDVSARSAVSALIYGTPKELLQAQFEDVARFRDIAAKVVQWDETTPQNYEYRWISLHGMGAFSSALGNAKESAGPLIVSRDQWSGMAKQAREEFRSGVEKAIDQYQKQKDSAAIKARH